MYSIAYFIIDAKYDKSIHWITDETAYTSGFVSAGKSVADYTDLPKPTSEKTVKKETGKKEPAQSSIQHAGATVYVTKMGTKFHRETYSSLSKSKISMPYEEACLQYEPCGKCKP